MAQLVASVSAVELGGVAEVVGLNLARGKIFTISLHIYIYIYICPFYRGAKALCNTCLLNDN